MTAQPQTPWWVVIVTLLLYLATQAREAVRRPTPTQPRIDWLEHEVLDGDLGHLGCEWCTIARAKGDGLTTT